MTDFCGDRSRNHICLRLGGNPRDNALDSLDLDGIILQMIFCFLSPGVVQFVSRGAIEFLLAPVNIQRVASGAVSREEFFAHLPSAVKLARFGDDHGPTENGNDEQNPDANLAFGGCLFEGEAQGPAGKQRCDKVHSYQSLAQGWPYAKQFRQSAICPWPNKPAVKDPARCVLCDGPAFRRLKYELC